MMALAIATGSDTISINTCWRSTGSIGEPQQPHQNI